MENGRKIIPSQQKSYHNIPWNYDTEFADLITSRRQLRSMENSDTNRQRIKTLSKKVKIKVRKIRNDILKAKAEEINIAKQTRQVAKLWKKSEES